MKTVPEKETKQLPPVDPSLAIPAGIIDDVLKYLGSKPYVEVFQLIQAIQREAKQL